MKQPDRKPDPSKEPLFVCPDCRASLELEGESIFRCPRCRREYPFLDGVINLLPGLVEDNKLSEETTWAQGGYFTSAGTGFATSHRYDSHTPWVSLLHKHNEVRHFLDDVLPQQDFTGRILEIGTGIGYGSAIIKSHYPESMVVASDISVTALSNARQMAGMLQARVDHFVACDCERLPFADDTFDIVFGSAVVHHLLRPEDGMAEIHRVLRQGGRYIGTGEPLANHLWQALWKSRFGAPGDIARRCGVVDAVYSYREWQDIFAVFRGVNISVDKKWRYKLYHWFPPLYYRALSLLPDALIRQLFLCGVSVTAEK